MYMEAVDVLAFVFLLLLIATKPSREDLDREVASLLREAISSTTYDNGKNILSNLTTLGCRLRIDDCLEIIKKAYSISNSDYIFLPAITLAVREHQSAVGWCSSSLYADQQYRFRRLGMHSDPFGETSHF